MSDKIKWSTDVLELPDDVSFEGCRSRLNRPQKYEDERLFAYDCRKLAEYALLDVRYTSDVLEMFDALLDKKVPEKVQSSISYSLGEMVYCNPQIKGDVIDFGEKYHPLFEKDLINSNHLYTEVISDMNEVIHHRKEEKLREKFGKLKGDMVLDNEKVIEKPKKNINVNPDVVKNFLDKEY